MNTSLNTLESVLKRVLRQTFRNEVDSLKNVGETDIFAYEWYRTKTRLAQRKKALALLVIFISSTLEIVSGEKKTPA